MPKAWPSSRNIFRGCLALRIHYYDFIRRMCGVFVQDQEVGPVDPLGEAGDGRPGLRDPGHPLHDYDVIMRMCGVFVQD